MTWLKILFFYNSDHLCHIFLRKCDVKKVETLYGFFLEMQ